MLSRHTGILLFLLLSIGWMQYPHTLCGQSIPPPSGVQCLGCGGMNGTHRAGCPYVGAASGNAGNPLQAPRNALTPNAVINNLLQLYDLMDAAEANREALEAAQKAEREANRKAKLDSIAAIQHQSTRQALKGLPDEKLIASAPPHETAAAPMTQEERERHNLLGKGVRVTWNFGDFANAAPGGQIPEPVPAPELTDHEKLINEMIGKVEDNGGRLAAIGGRYMINVKDGVMRYLEDAAAAAASGNSAIMRETGNFEVKKITANALYETASETGSVYLEKAVESINGGIREAGIGAITNVSADKLREYASFDDLAKTWQQVK